MSQRRSVVAVSVKPKGFKLGHKQGSMSTTSPPPSSPDGNVSTSGPSAIKLSKNWELPQRLKPGRKPKSKRGDASANNDGSSKIKKVQTSDQKDQMTTKDHENEGAKGHGGKSDDEGNGSGDENGVDSVEKRRRQNRDAQRAYRERRTTRIQVLEEKVEMLHNLVDDWQRKYKLLEYEFSDTKENLQKSIALNNELQKALPLIVNTPFQQQPENPPDNPISILEMVENFKPIGAVSLKKRKAEGPLSTSHVPAVLTDQSLSEIDIANDSQYLSGRQFSSTNSSLDGHINSPLSSCSNSINACAGSGNKKIKCCGNKDAMKPVTCCNQKNNIMPSLVPVCCSEKKIESDAKKSISKCCGDKEIYDSENRPITKEDGSWIPGSCKQCRSDPHSRNFCQSLSNKCSSSSFSSNSALSPDLNEQQTDVNYNSIKLPEICSCKNAQMNAASDAKRYLPISYTYQKIRQHMQKNKSIQEQLNPEDSTSISSALENIASGLHVRGQKVELQSIKDALHKMDKNVLE
ncbi:BBM_1a_G0048350.mRNA.1.CDS.1 [Saccharomyces cerevisiae]|nr:BBM_1a_G0048350.mRNA.1.CDS.1 [Saccharomyces cerevisiae]CAI7328354.1 BBM_1a_G0048350.mRNA.1.CDS.1 [Saccharomyces cerevisiae]